jgi:hypothetical protein
LRLSSISRWKRAKARSERLDGDLFSGTAVAGEIDDGNATLADRLQDVKGSEHQSRVFAAEQPIRLKAIQFAAVDEVLSNGFRFVPQHPRQSAHARHELIASHQPAADDALQEQPRRLVLLTGKRTVAHDNPFYPAGDGPGMELDSPARTASRGGSGRVRRLGRGLRQ